MTLSIVMLNHEIKEGLHDNPQAHAGPFPDEPGPPRMSLHEPALRHPLGEVDGQG